MKLLWWLYREYIKIAKMAACSKDFLCEDDFDAVLTIFRSYRYGANASGAIWEDCKTMKKIIIHAPCALQFA